MGIGAGCVTASARRGGSGGGGGGWGRRPAYVKTLYRTIVCDTVAVQIDQLKGKKYVTFSYAFNACQRPLTGFLKYEILTKTPFFHRQETTQKVLRAIVATYLADCGVEPTEKHYVKKPLSFILYHAQSDKHDERVDEIVKVFFNHW